MGGDFGQSRPKFRVTANVKADIQGVDFFRHHFFRRPLEFGTFGVGGVGDIGERFRAEVHM
ncbi:hypothetical protein A3C96_01875 [Candidatus Uhrbacteria bacterium RIFCSPHIGHO2_02_FULL_60_10]|uniref:Uncharacterized protein n=1 Tax=Candidatus Uhrbacteria bacterium RIFCSPHIGHO2_02_FULL_60_10 TaxID=1802392 RepID=A0A1F7U8S9_9BACT|nr:MAG: hypothetical protein A3C96_01875 [Candidatus Uhrbacteria bacterium RIFCSPHIGHO2_02_FULL_60_10]